MTLPTIHALWIGKQLGKVSSACLLSFVKQGHEVILHCYDDIDDLPNGVKTSDANLIIPKDEIFKHKKTGSYAIFADVFRYALLKMVDGIYVDCDVYCLKPLTLPEHGYLFGFEDDCTINNAILALPKNSCMLEKLNQILHDKYFIPAWYPIKKQKRLKFKKQFGFSKHISEMPWGITGPKATSYFAKECKVDDLAQKIDIFYPIHYDRISMLTDESLTINELITHRTLCIHLYNERLRYIDLDNLHKNSLLYQLLQNEI